MAYRGPKTDLTRGVLQKKLASKAYRTIGGVARNSIANRAIVEHLDNLHTKVEITELIRKMKFGSIIPPPTLPNTIPRLIRSGVRKSTAMSLAPESKQFKKHIGSAIAEQVRS